MTCIAYDGKTLAGDSLITIGDTDGKLVVPCLKVRRLRIKGRTLVVGFAGAPAEYRKLLDLWIKGETEKEMGVHLVVAEMKGNTHRATFVESTGYAHDITGVNFAIGSGAQFAFGAMHFGATARQAVATAGRHCNTVGGPIRAVALGRIHGKAAARLAA